MKQLNDVLKIINNVYYYNEKAKAIKNNNYKKLFKYCLYENDNDTYKNLYLGLYYQYVDKNYELMRKYYLMEIDAGNGDAMYYLGYYYKYIGGGSE